jgi:hypothetical protein
MGHRVLNPRSPGRWRPTVALPQLAGFTMAALAAMGLPFGLAAADTLQRSREQLKRFPFSPDCGGNTQEMVACLWQRRNGSDASLERLLGQSELLEQWRSSRQLVCGQAARKAQGGSIQPIVALSCENALNQELLRQLRRPLAGSAAF